MLDADRLLTISEVAERLRRPEATLRWWRHVGVGPRSARLRGRVVYRAGDVEEWIAAEFDAESPSAAISSVGGSG